MSTLVTIENFSDSISANIAKGALEAAGIACVLQNDTLISSRPYLSVTFGGINLQVKKEDAEKAKKILASTNT